ncbi:acyltransferase family protein [Curtobacterium sp. SL109]|uniref:acyltransferase family protein n=1 Tax=Curtobacterium sp. SL109 TaxID=2994662 RepID=UPI0022746F35|nr:acyltransferase [Curtobacterium sp. SL109]MCY1693720.1 acyltransferase [Curtobacterium sp. SL109]
MPSTMQATTQPFDRPSTLPSLTGLRWIAAFTVFAYHVRNLGLVDGRSQTLLTATMGAGATGVSLFFILSGFILGWGHQSGTRATTFWWRRLARIYPLHFIAVIAAVLLARLLVPSIATASPKALLANFFLISDWHGPWWQTGNPVSWSLVCEAFFYLAFPLVISIATRTSTAGLWIAAAVSVLLSFGMPILLSSLPGGLSSASWPPARLPEFIIGVLVACLLRRGAWRGPGVLMSALLAAAGFAAADRYTSSPFALVGFTVVGFTLLIAALARADVTGRATVLASPPLIALGERSFAFYLVHLLVIDAIAALVPPDPARPAVIGFALAVLALNAALAIASILHPTVEKPARRWLVALPARLSTPSRRISMTDRPAPAFDRARTDEVTPPAP